MAARLAAWRADRLLQAVIALIGLHSCALGVVMLFAPRFMLRMFGFSLSIPIFFPSQSGIFLLILGVCYLVALIEPGFVKVILISKAFAVLFLFTHAAFLSPPPMIWAAGAGDATMLVLLGAFLSRHQRGLLTAV